MVKIIRRLIALGFYKLGDIVSDYKSNQEVLPFPQVKEVVKPKMVPGLVKFTDMETYLKEVTKNTEKGGVFINICNRLKTMSIEHKSAIRFNYSKNTTYKPDGTQAVKHATIVSGFNNSRWHKLSGYDLNGAHVVSILNEMAEAMAQAGWGCANDGVHQLQEYMVNSSRNCENYLEERVNLIKKEGKLRVSIFLIVNMNPNPHHEQPEPKLIVEIITWPPGSRVPVKTQHTMFFSQYAPIESEKNVA